MKEKKIKGGKLILRKEFKIKRLEITIDYKSSDGWGRFGGGWNWVVGFQAGGHSLILNLLIFSITFYIGRGK